MTVCGTSVSPRPYEVDAHGIFPNPYQIACSTPANGMSASCSDKGPLQRERRLFRSNFLTDNTTALDHQFATTGSRPIPLSTEALRPKQKVNSETGYTGH